MGMTKNRLIDVQNYQRETLDFFKQEMLAMGEMDRQDQEQEVITDDHDCKLGPECGCQACIDETENFNPKI